jgi:hypothetical protein
MKLGSVQSKSDVFSHRRIIVRDDLLKQPHSISCESDSKVTRIESFAFLSSSLRSIVIPCSVQFIESFALSLSSLQSIMIPRRVQFIDGSAFCSVELSSCDIESGNDRFAIDNDFLIDILSQKLIYIFSDSFDITIPSSIEIV